MSLLAPSALLPQAGDSKDTRRFVLASSDWLDLQTRVQALLALPSDLGEYEECYGFASAGSQMTKCFDAMHKLQRTASRYGCPKQLRARILNQPRFLASAARPRNDAFSATVWTLEHAHHDALMLAETLRSLPALARREYPSEIAAAIKARFFDRGQVIDTMRDTVAQVDLLIAEFQSLEAELDAAQLAMQAFTDRSSRIRACLDKEIGALQKRVVTLERARDAAYQSWLSLATTTCIVPATIAVVGIVVMVLLAVPPAAASFAVGPAPSGARSAASVAALRTAAGAARTAYGNLVADIQPESDYFAGRVCFRTDLGALDQLMKFSLPASSGVVGQLLALRNAWASSIREFGAHINDLTAANLQTCSWLRDPVAMTAAASWTRLDAAIRACVAGSFVDASLIDFGNVLPHDDSSWLNHFELRRAA